MYPRIAGRSSMGELESTRLAKKRVSREILYKYNQRDLASEIFEVQILVALLHNMG